MITVGLTGGMGSGKSSVARRFREHGAHIIDADAIARDIVAPGEPALNELADEFGADILDEDGVLRRAELARRAFASDEARQRLNAITHPRIAQRTKELFAARGDNDIVVHDMPLLVENDLAADHDIVVVVYAPAATRIERLSDHRGVDAADAQRRIAAQLDDDERMRHADVILDNSATSDMLREQVDRVWTERILPMREPRGGQGGDIALPLGFSCARDIAAPAAGRKERERARLTRLFGAQVTHLVLSGDVVHAQVEAPIEIREHPWDEVGGTWVNRDPGNPVIVSLGS